MCCSVLRSGSVPSRATQQTWHREFEIDDLCLDLGALAAAGTQLLDLPGVLLARIWKELVVEDRKALCCTAKGFRECPGV